MSPKQYGYQLVLVVASLVQEKEVRVQGLTGVYFCIPQLFMYMYLELFQRNEGTILFVSETVILYVEGYTCEDE